MLGEAVARIEFVHAFAIGVACGFGEDGGGGDEEGFGVAFDEIARWEGERFDGEAINENGKTVLHFEFCRDLERGTFHGEMCCVEDVELVDFGWRSGGDGPCAAWRFANDRGNFFALRVRKFFGIVDILPGVREQVGGGLERDGNCRGIDSARQWAATGFIDTHHSAAEGEFILERNGHLKIVRT